MMKIATNCPEVVAALKKDAKAMQTVTAATLTDVAKAVTVRSERNIRHDMIVRTPYTTRSLKTYKASPSRPIARQDSVSGTASDYLPIQDTGGKVKARRKVIAVPTNAVRGADRKKKVPSKYRINNMPKAFVLHPSSPSKILRRPALFLRRGKRLIKVRDLGARDYQLKATRWHSEAVGKYGNYAYMGQVFAHNGRRYLKHAE
jgi:hypothetical protein